MNGAANPRIGAATAQDSGQRRVDVAIGRIGRSCEQRCGRHDLA